MEVLILYFVLFFPAIFNSPFPINLAQSQPISFSIIRELGRTFTYTIPSLALLWYLVSDKNGFSALRDEKPHKRDLLPFSIGLSGLIIIGLFISLLVWLFSGQNTPPKVDGPVNAAGWIVLVFSCLGTGYLEESYFRYYILNKLEVSIPNETIRIILSMLLFAFCHIYEGPWGIINALLAGALLAVIFLRYRSLNGIAWAHGLYNIFVYAVGAGF